MENETTQDNKASILADVWLNYRSDDEFVDFVEYNDLGLPLAYAIANKIVAPSPKSISFINESFSLLLAGLGVEDTGFETLEEILEYEPEEEGEA
jgi:hypothetical protein